MQQSDAACTRALFRHRVRKQPERRGRCSTISTRAHAYTRACLDMEFLCTGLSAATPSWAQTAHLLHCSNVTYRMSDMVFIMSTAC